MGLALGHYLKAEADFVERLTRPGPTTPRLDVVLLDPAFVEQLRKADRGRSSTRQRTPGAGHRRLRRRRRM